ncbi:MAG: hypothetical protein K0S25_25 [Bacillus sp. (in: firmicutes)]|jgi:hypothetical protein|nr:hypothetical protein [Bacillus sp. (in: firmicutes)]
MAYQPKSYRKFVAKSAVSRCDFAGCTDYATTKGIVFARNESGGNDIPTPVSACDKHKKMSSFFEDVNSVVIEYRTRKDYCHCCDQKLSNPKISEIREFEFNKDNLLSWGDWKDIAEFEEDLRECVRDYVCETISFFATNSSEKLIISPSEFGKVQQFVLNTIKS